MGEIQKRWVGLIRSDSGFDIRDLDAVVRWLGLKIVSAVYEPDSTTLVSAEIGCGQEVYIRVDGNRLEVRFPFTDEDLRRLIALGYYASKSQMALDIPVPESEWYKD